MNAKIAAEEVDQDHFPFFRVYKDGRVERLHNYVYVAPSNNLKSGVRSKDIFVNNNSSARLYMPKITEQNQKFPLLVYIHGGGFSIESAFSTGYDKYLHTLVEKANLVTISIDYRLAPEHPLPMCYDDSWAVMKWAALHASDIEDQEDDQSIKEPWLEEHADFSSVFLAGDSAGANIAHDMLVRASDINIPLGNDFRIVGIALIHPFFSNYEHDKYLEFIFPTCQGLDDPRINPAAHPRLLSSLVCHKVIVFTAEMDFMRDRSLTYYEAVKKSGWKGEVEIMETKREDHVFHLIKPTCDKAAVLMQRLVNFFNEKI